MELPKTSDMVTLKEFLDSEISNSLTKQKLSPRLWTETAQALIVRILLLEMKVSGRNESV